MFSSCPDDALSTPLSSSHCNKGHASVVPSERCEHYCHRYHRPAFFSPSRIGELLPVVLAEAIAGTLSIDGEDSSPGRAMFDPDFVFDNCGDAGRSSCPPSRS